MLSHLTAPRRGRSRLWLVVLPVVCGVAVVAVALTHLVIATQRQQDTANFWERRTQLILQGSAELMSAVLDVETGERGFLLSGDQAYLEPYRRGMAALPRLLDNLTGLTADNKLQQAHLATLRSLIGAKLAFAGKLIGQRQAGALFGSPEIPRTGQGRLMMNAIRSEIALLKSGENALMAQRRLAAQDADTAAWNSIYQLIVLGAVLLVGGLLATAAAWRAMRRTQVLEQERRLSGIVMAELEKRMEERTRELAESHGQLRQMQKLEAIGQLTGGIAHDFNNMLSIIIGSLDMARRRQARGDTDVMRFVTHALGGAMRAADLTRRLLAFSRQQPLEPVVVACNALVASMSELLRRTIGEHVMLETVLAGGLWRTMADAGQIENVILNLAVNARDAMPDGGKLTIETGNVQLDDAYAAGHLEVKAGQYVMIAVTDTGTGMTQEVAARAFDPFFTTKSVDKGTGLGLSQVFGFVKQSKGHVKIYSELNRGTTIKVYLPRYFGEEEMMARRSPSQEIVPEGRRDELILLVEDDQNVRRMSVDALRDLGYSVLHAPNGQQALRMLVETPSVTLLFTDIVMPGMNGRELADAAQLVQPGLRVLYTTGYTRNAVVHDGTLDPGTAFLSKPFSMMQLASKVRQTIDADQTVS